MFLKYSAKISQNSVVAEDTDINTYFDTSSSLGRRLGALVGGYKKIVLYKTFFAKGPFLLIDFAFVLILVFYAGSAQAGILSDIINFFNPSIGESSNFAAAAISMPLLGSQTGNSFNGTGGPSVGKELLPLLAVQDSALVASRNPAGTLPPSYSDQILVYTVQDGDTPGGIAEKFGITLNTLLWANNIRNPNLIKIGDEIVVLPVPGIQVEVKKGDTIESIAKKFKGDVNEIRVLNGLGIDEQVKTGVVLIIPDGEITIPSVSPETSVPRFAGLPSAPRGYYMRPIFGGRMSRGIHGYNGVDLAAPRGTPILASAKGTVIIARASGWNGGYGKYIVLSHPNGTQTLYAHADSILARVGQYVAQGSQIAAVGSTGNSTGSHVHFEIRGDAMPPEFLR